MAMASAAIFGTFHFISYSVQQSRNKTLANNLAQEQIELLKDKSYSNILPTPAPSYNSSFSPAIAYDTLYYPLETIRIGKIVFQRLTYVERVLPSAGALVAVAYDNLDTGLKRITVTTIWQLENNWYKVSITNLVSNPLQAFSGGFQGTISKALGGAIAGANVFVQDVSNSVVADSNGKYAFSVSPGTYTLVASAAGYLRQSAPGQSVNSGNSLTVDFTLTPVSSGSVSGAVYVNNHLLVSQVIASSVTTVADLSTQDVEYVELFNPTTFNMAIGQTGTPVIQVNYKGQSASDDVSNIALTYISTYVSSGRYYLIANATNFVILGQSINANAYYSSLYSDVIKKDKAGAIQIANSAGQIIDGAGWSHSAVSITAPWAEGSGIAQVGGLQQGDQIVRLSSVAVVSSAYGRAYDSDENDKNFAYRGQFLSSGLIEHKPFNSSSSPLPIIGGTPAFGAIVTANDGLSASTISYRTTQNGFTYSTFTLVGIATGTWTVEISSGNATLAISSVSVLTQGVNVAIPNASTNPSWPASNASNSILSSTTTNGYVAGRVTDALSVPIAGVTVNVEPASSGLTDSNGNYSIAAPAGTYSIVANPSNMNSAFNSATITNVTVVAGQTNSGNNLVLGGAGQISGYVCNFSAANPYPGITTGAYDTFDNLKKQAITGADGKFTIRNVSTGTYTIKPTLDTGQSASPTSFSASLIASGSSVVVGTFTITGAYGVIAGSATLSGSSILTGVLVVATTGTISGSLPPDLSSATLNSAPYYMTSSLSDGNYRLSVRASTASSTFNLYGWYTTFTGNTSTTTKKSAAGVVVNGGQTTQRTLQW